eukprot:TRINITY_DN1104_c0_g1_i1.p1 TRINITY_DN1104_c0_g1~~TRINITY_DN1104_c0_g1_i1.p1  ORF type:complete len:169 (+),score=34.81 TRINITY_DN1104_c0_g1_i1:77-508(+)
MPKDGTWSQFDTKKTGGEETWRSGSMWNCFQEMDVCWMTFFCGPCMIGREWSAAKNQETYRTNWPVCLASLFCGLCIVTHLRTATRKIGDPSVAKDNPEAWIPGSVLEDCLCTWCCGPCVVCHIGRELKARSYPCGTICQRME